MTKLFMNNPLPSPGSHQITHTSMYIYIHTWVCMQSHTHTHTHRKTNIQVCPHTNTQMNRDTYTHQIIRIHPRLKKHTTEHTHTHTHTFARRTTGCCAHHGSRSNHISRILSLEYYMSISPKSNLSVILREQVTYNCDLE